MLASLLVWVAHSTVTAQAWGLRQRLTMPAPSVDAEFGGGGALDGDVLAIGAPFLARGRVFIHRRVAGRWLLEATLGSPMGVDDDRFGRGMAVEGDVLAVAAPGESGRAGTIYVYQRSGIAWPLVATLTGSSPRAGGELGSVLDMDGGQIAARACADGSERVHVFAADGAGVWSESQVLSASDAGNRTGCNWGDDLLSMEGARLALLEPDQRNPDGSIGAVFVFERPFGPWLETDRIVVGGASGSLDPAVAMTTDRLAVGTPYAGSTAPPVRLFDRGAPGWSEVSPIAAPGGDRGHGRSLAFLESRLAVCSDRSSLPPGPEPACRVYRDDPSGYVLEAELPTPPTARASFGQGVDAAGTTIIVYAWSDTVDGVAYAGAAYVFVLAEADGTVCSDPEECISGFCVDGVCCDTECGGGVEDCGVCSVASGASIDGVCSPRPLSEPLVCRPAAGPCDVDEGCDGASIDCPVDGLVGAGVICREAAGACDLAESCSGADPSCPGDQRAGDDVVCRPVADPCDLQETCTGISNECPSDLRSECSPDAGGVAADGGVRVDASVGAPAAGSGCSCRAIPAGRGAGPTVLMLFGLLLLRPRRRGE